MGCVAHELGRRPILALRICGSRGKLGLKVVIDSASEARTTNHWFHLSQERPSQCVGHCQLGMTVSPQLRPTGMCAPVWATAPRFRLMPLRRADQLAVGTCSDQSVKGQSSTWTLMTSNLLRVSVLQQTWWKVWSVIFVIPSWTSLLKVVIQDWQFPVDVPTWTTNQGHMFSHVWSGCPVHPLLIAVAWQKWRSGVTTDRRGCGCNSQVLRPQQFQRAGWKRHHISRCRVASMQEQAHAWRILLLNVRVHLQMNLTWSTQWGMTSALIMLKMMRRVFVKDLWRVPKLARCRTHQSNARFQAEMSGTQLHSEQLCSLWMESVWWKSSPVALAS